MDTETIYEYHTSKKECQQHILQALLRVVLPHEQVYHCIFLMVMRQRYQNLAMGIQVS